MFYSHQLLARKAPLGQIWMAATMHAKINRRRLDKLNIIKICEEILNPSVPMALRLSGILMGGVVIVYERKVKLLYEDVTRLLVEINEAWKVKSVADPTVLPKGKSQAKFEAVTLPRHEETEVGEMEQSLQFSSTTTPLRFQHAEYFTMQLDTVDEPYVVGNPKEDDLSQHHHQADAANITLLDPFDSFRTDTDIYNRFERFDIEGDEDTQLNFTPRELPQVPITLVPSPPPQEMPQQVDESQAQHPEPKDKQQSDEYRQEAFQPQQKEQGQGPRNRKARKRPNCFVLDYEQTIIPGHMYQSWLQNPSDIVSRSGRKRKHINPMFTMKIKNLMEMPPVALCGSSAYGSGEFHYPAPLLKLWIRYSQLRTAQDSLSGRTSPPQPPEPSSSSPPERPVEDSRDGFGAQPSESSVEKLRINLDNIEVPRDVSMEKLRANLDNIEVPVNEASLLFTPGNSGDDARSIPSSASGHRFPAHDPEFELHSGRSTKKRPYSSSKHSASSLEPVAEESPWQPIEPGFKLTRLSENGFTPDHELLVETGPTPTQHPIVNQSIDKITDSIRKHLKTHFDTPGAPQIESLNQLACGMNRQKAAQLFYQTCVLATHDLVKVEQTIAYGDILVSRGSKM